MGRRGFRIQFARPSDLVYLLAGDFSHNLRSVLDHIVYAAIIRSTKKAPDSPHVQWPVQTEVDGKNFDRITKGVPAEAARIIRSLQPYHEGSGEAYKQNALWQLHKLDIVDKHRRIAINEVAVDSFFPGLGPSSDIQNEVTEFGFEITFPQNYPLVEMRYAPNPKIRFGDADEGLFVDVERLGSIYDFVVKNVLPKFARFV
jgi:hypothetical protein